MYIRTKDGVYEVVDTYEVKYVIGYTEDGFEISIYKENVISQSENLDELCDEFVYQTGGSISKGNPMISINDFLSLKEWYVTGGINQNNIFGAIWTSKGLIYVAKMNDEGELELIWQIY